MVFHYVKGVEHTEPPISGIDVGTLPLSFQKWFVEKGWSPRPSAGAYGAGTASENMLLIAPTGAGKTLGGFMASLTDLTERARYRLAPALSACTPSTSSPLKALAVDIERNLTARFRNGSADCHRNPHRRYALRAKRQRQKVRPPDILLTTPEQAPLLPPTRRFALFRDLKYVVLDAAAFARHLQTRPSAVAGARPRAPACARCPFHRPSATVAEPMDLRRYLALQGQGKPPAGLITVEGGAKPDISICTRKNASHGPGHSARYAGRLIRSVEVASDDAGVCHRRRRKGSFRSSGRLMTTICRSHCITARWMPGSAAGWKRPWRKTGYVPLLPPPPLDFGIDW